MTLTKQQKTDMIFDVELRLAKEELAEQYVKNLKTIENSKKPLRTLKNIDQKDTPPIMEVEQEKYIVRQALSEYQRDEWHNLNERHFDELKLLSSDADLHGFAEQNQEELKQLLARHGRDRDRIEKSKTPLEEEQAILYSYDNDLDPGIMARLKQKTVPLTNEEKQLLEQSEEAVKTPFKKSGMGSKSQWEFIGLETQAMRENVPKSTNRHIATEEKKLEFNLQEHFENTQSMPHDHDMDMER